MQKRTIQIRIETNVYNVNFPNVGQMMDIENMKMSLTNGSYADMVRSGLKSSYYNTEIVDTIAHLWVLIPELRADLQVRNFSELDPFVAKKLLKVYREQFTPWYEKLMKELMSEEVDNVVPKIEEGEKDVLDLN
jgi:hypothetical protein